jgi:polysaccharide export outer membrane protein
VQPWRLRGKNVIASVIFAKTTGVQLIMIRIRTAARGCFRLGWVSVMGLICLLLGGVAVAQDAIEAAYLGDEYRIGPEDVLEISVWKEPDLQRQVLVRPDGGVSFPLAGDVQAAGRTARELEAVISQRIRQYIPEAVVTVSVATVAGYRIFILGKVRDPGQYVVGRYIDVLQALTLAGGLTPYASQSKIKIIRREGDIERVIPFSYSDAEDGEELDQNILLKSGDVVVVP